MGAFAKLRPGEQMILAGGVSLIAEGDGITIMHLGNESDSSSTLDGLYCMKDDEGNFLLCRGEEGCLAVFDESEV